MSLFPHLFSPFEIKGLEIKNRIFSTGHDTDLARNGLPSDELIAYQSARARGGAGLIVVQVVAVHRSAKYTSEVLLGTDDRCIPHFKKLFDAIHAQGTKVFVQLFHPGRELASRRDGIVQTAWGVSSVPSERFHVVPKVMSADEVGHIVGCYGATARRLVEAGADGLEIVASHGYLPAQFLSGSINTRDDRYGGTYENRLRFIREVANSVRREVPDHIVVGGRFSGNEYDEDGLDENDMFVVCRDLSASLDYLNVIAGTSSSSSGAVHIVPPMTVKTGYMAPFSQKLKQATVDTAIFVAGRINQPHEAESILRNGSADMCGMTRAMICDPFMPSKAQKGLTDDIRACIACNQACIGHAQLGIPISCIQHPETGRELRFLDKPKAARSQKVLVVGGGPGGMKAAAVAAEMGHDVELVEKSARLGGQARLAQLLPNREEFGGIITNLAREVENARVEVRLDREVDKDFIEEGGFDSVILATGGEIRMPPFSGGEGIQVLSHEDLLNGAKAGGRVVVFDWRSDWVGIGIAERLVANGASVRLAVNGICPGAAIQSYVRDAAIARLYRLGVELIPFARLYGAEDGTVFLTHTAAQEAIVLEDVETLVIAAPYRPVAELQEHLDARSLPYQIIGDAASPRTAEEAVYEGLEAAFALHHQDEQ